MEIEYSQHPPNVLELRAVKKALNILRPVLLETALKIILGNVSAVSYVRKPGGTSSVKLLEVKPIMNWAHNNLLDITAVHIEGVKNY